MARLMPLALALACGCSRGKPSPPRPASSSAPVASSAPSPSASAAPSANASSGLSFPIARKRVEEVLNPTHLPAYDGPTGSVEGAVYVTGPDAPDVHVDARACPAALDTYGKLFRSGKPATPGGPRPLGDAVVVAVGYTGFYVPDRQEVKRVTINTSCAYPSRSIAMTFGERLEIVNESPIPFAPVIEREFSPAVMMAPPRGAGDPVKVYPRQAGYSPLGDRMATFVKEDLYVFRFPLHAETDLNGHYRIDGLPVGKLTIAARHPGVGGSVEQPIEVVADTVKRVDLTMTYKPRRPPNRTMLRGIP